MAVAELREHAEATGTSWEASLEALAAELRALPADADLQARLELSQRAVALLAVGFAAEVEWLARCCELSASLGEPLIAAPAALDRQVIAVRRLRLEALADRTGQSRRLRVERPGPVVPIDDEPEAAPEPPAAHPPIGGDATPGKALRPRSERVHRTTPADPEAAAEWQARRERIAQQAGRRGPMATAQARGAEPAPAPEVEPAALPESCEQRPERRAPAQWKQSVMPDGFLRAHEAAELLGVSTGTISRWRKAGRLGEQGPDWRAINGRDIAYSVAAVERLEGEQEEAAKARIGQLLAQLPPCAPGGSR